MSIATEVKWEALERDSGLKPVIAVATDKSGQVHCFNQIPTWYAPPVGRWNVSGTAKRHSLGLQPHMPSEPSSTLIVRPGYSAVAGTCAIDETPTPQDPPEPRASYAEAMNPGGAYTGPAEGLEGHVRTILGTVSTLIDQLPPQARLGLISDVSAILTKLAK